MVDLAASALATLPTPPTYIRVDVVGRGSTMRIMELEVNEPDLGCHLVPKFATRFADALLGARKNVEPASGHV